MITAQIYCTLAELIDDLNLQGNQPRLFERIRAASRDIYANPKLGNFIPISEARNFEKNTLLQLSHPRANTGTLFVPPILSIASVVNNTVTVTGYDPWPLNRYWPNGPYTRLEASTFIWYNTVITGAWGLYSETKSLGETVTQLINATTITVTDGSLLSPGMVLLIDDEQELVTGYGAVTDATSLLYADITEADEEIDVDDGTEFNEGEVIQLSTEDCYIRMVRGDTLVCSRGWNNTTKAAHLENDAIAVYRTYTVDRGVNGTTAAAHASKALSRYVVPEDVNWLCREMAGLRVRKAQSGFSGKVGNAETGEVAYYSDYPSTTIKEVERHYRMTTL